MAADPPADPDRYDEAIRAFRRRVPMTDPEFRALEADERQRAFWVAGVTQARVVQEIKDALDRAVRDGTTLEDFKAEAGGKLAEAWGGQDAPRLETVFRTNVLSAYNGGRTEVFDDPVIREARPYLRFDAVGDSRTSEICEALDGTVLPADDPFWERHTPPLHFNCRSILTPLSPEEAEDEGITKGKPDVGDAAPDEGFGRPQRAGEDAGPDPQGLDPEIERLLRAKVQAAPAPPPPPPRPPPPSPVDHGPKLPLVAPEPRAPKLERVGKVKFKVDAGPLPSGTASVGRWFGQNQGPLRQLAKQVRRQSGMGMEVPGFIVKQMDNRGEFDPMSGWILLNREVGENVARAVARGETVTVEELQSVKTLLHEMWHAASNQKFSYRAGGTLDMEEATTEVLAQHFVKSFAEKSLGLKVNPASRSNQDALFGLGADGAVTTNRPTSYPQQVIGFARMVTYVDRLDLDQMTPDAFQNHIAGRALQAKRQVGTVDENHRFGMFVRPILERHNIVPGSRRYEDITERLHRLLADIVHRGAATQADFDREVAAIIGRGGRS